MIGKRPTAKKTIGKSPSKTVTKTEPEDDEDDEDVAPAPKKALEVKIKPKKAPEPEPPEEDDEETDDDDGEEEKPPTKKESRQIALRNAERLGVKSFEVEPEPFEDESFDNEDRLLNARKNDEKIAATAVVTGADQNRVRGLTTLFGQRSDTILRLLDNDEETDGALTLIHRTLLQTLVDVLPVVERSIRRSKGKRGVIPFNQMISQVRELVTDIQSLRDKGQLGASIIERVVRPAYLDLASQVVIAFMEIETSARSRMNDDDFKSFRDDVLQVTKRSLAQYLNSQYEGIKNDVINSLS